MTPKYIFTIKGNQEDPRGNPIPYFRVTSKSKFADGSIRYAKWKDYVRGKLYDCLKQWPIEIVKNYQAGMNPIFLEKDQHARMDLVITWANEAHGDCDNIFKGIADALFVNDKHLAGSFEYRHGREGSVDVVIWILTDEEVDSSIPTAGLQGSHPRIRAG